MNSDELESRVRSLVERGFNGEAARDRLTKRYVGYHYTTAALLDGPISSEGLRPMSLNGRLVRDENFCHVGEAVWVWDNRLTGASRMGTFLWIWVKNGIIEPVVELQVTYNWDDLAKSRHCDQDTLSLLHNGKAFDWEYHKGERATLLVRTIPPEQLRVLGRWGVNRLEETDEFREYGGERYGEGRD